MVRRFPWCTVVALVVLLFVTTEGLRERSTQIDDHRITSRGTLRFSKSQEESSTVPSLSRSRTSRDRLSQSKRVSNFENRNEGSTLATVIASEPKFDSTKHSFVRTTRTTEIGSIPTAADTTNDLKRSPLTQNAEETKKVESSNRRNGKRYPSGSNDGAKSKDSDQKAPAEPSKSFPRRTSSGRAIDSGASDRLDNKGPSVFQATTESSRSRTGRKIQTTYSTKDLKTQIPTSRRFNNKKIEDAETTTISFRREGRGRSTTERVERSTRSGRSKVNSRENNSITRRGPDALSESESIRVDIPLTVDGTQSSLLDSTTSFGVVAQRRSDAKELPRSGTRTGSERSKGRGRSNDSETAGSSRSSSRRGSSKFNDFTTTEANEQIVSSRKNTVSRDRARGSEAKKTAAESRSRSRGRNLENSIKSTASGTLERDVKRKSQERISSDRRSRIPDAAPRFIESRGQDTQDTRGRSRSRSRSDVTTPITTDVTATVAPDTTVFNDVTTSSPEITSTTVTQATPMTTTSSPRPTRPTSTSTSPPESTGRGRGRGRGGSQGRKKEDFFNHGLGFRGRKLPPEGASNVPESRRTTPSKNDSQLHGNPGWTLRRRPGHFNNSENPPRNVIPSPRDQTNEVIPPNEQSTSTEAATTVESSTSSTRRGSKKLQTTEESSTMAETTTKSSRRGNKTFGPGKGAAELEESDNYPPEFKARLNQLKNTNTKTPAPKTTSRTPLEVKKSTAALFAERSRMKLELARRLVKPELNIEENDLDATTASSFSKPKPSGVPPVVGETSKVAKYSKPPTATGRRGFVESSREEVSVKASKLSSSRKGLEDSSKVIGRPYNLKKGRIIAERMVTSISVEERAVDETTKPYVLTTKPSVITSASAEEGSATTIDSTRIRLTGRERKKSKEEDSTTSDKNVKVSLQSNRRVENNDAVTTFKPKKPYVYQPRNSKFNSTSIEQSSTTVAPKKSYSSAERKSQTPQQEDITKKSKFGSNASKPTFRPRYSKRTKQKSSEEKAADYQDTLTTKVPIPTSRYSRKKSVVKAVNAKSKSVTTEGSVTQSKKLEFRPRTATYRRHSEVPTTLVESTTKVDGAGVAITPRSTRFHATLKTSTVSPQSVAQEPQVNLRIANESAQEAPGITGSSNGDSGNTNIFNPTRSTFLTGNGTLLEQLRSTVAPLLSSLGNKTPVFSGSYSNVNNANSAPRVTPNGQPPRFSARYKGAELFIRKQNNVYQPTVPSITSSSTTPVTPVESNALLNTQMGTASVTPIVSTGRPPTDSQGGRIVQDRERDEATRTKEAGGQRSSVYIGQDKFVNYWTDGASTTNPRVLSVNINSVATGANEGPSTSIPSFENLLNNQPGGRVTAPPGFPWRDPLDQIFGITTSSPIMTASVASNTLDDSSGPNNPALTRPINPFVEVFTPFSSAIGVPKGNIGTLPPPPSTTTVASTTSAPSTTTTTTMAPTTTTTTTMAPTTTTTTTMAPTTTTTTMAPTTTTTTTTTTMAPTTTTMASTTTTMAAPATINQRANIASQTTASPETTPAAPPQTTPFNIPQNLLNAQQQQQQENAFGTTFDDLAFLNSLLQSNTRSTTQVTLTQVEQLLANKILSLALNNPGPTRSPKAINIENASPNSLFQSPTKSPSEPIVIDLSPSSTAAAPTWNSPEIERPTSQKSILNSLNSEQVTWKPVTTTTTKRDIEISTASPSTATKTTLISTTKVPVTVTTKRVTTQRPRTTTQAPLGFAGLLWQTFGGLFGPSTTPKPVKTVKPVKTTQKSVNITPKPIQVTQRLETVTTTTPSTTTLRALDVSKIYVNTPNSIVQEERLGTTPVSISTTKRSLLNNPNPRLPSVVTSTYSPEEDAKFLVELLRAVQQENKSAAPKKTESIQDDESFLRAILSGRALTTTPSPPTEISNAALLAALLKAQGIEPPTPAINIREQLQSASLGQSVTSAPAASPSSESTTITTRPASAATRPPDSTKKTVTPRPTSRPRIRTTTWSPSSTYPPPFLSSFSNYGTPAQSADSNDSGNGALFGATRAFSQFLGAAISGAAQQLQSLVRNGTRIVSEVVG